MSQWLYMLQPTRAEMLIESTAEEDAIVGEHFLYLQALTEQGIMILVGRTLNTDPSSFGIAIFDAEDEESARAIMRNDPAVAQGVMQAFLYPYRVALQRR